jgi:integrase
VRLADLEPSWAACRSLQPNLGGDTPVVQITKVEVEHYRSHLATQTVKVWQGGKNNPDLTRTDLWRDTGRPRTARTNTYYLKRLRYVLTGAHETRDPLTGVSALPFPPKVKLFPESKRVPRPMPDAEFVHRHAEAKAWTRDAMDLARKFGLRRREALMVTLDHIDHERRELFFSAE